MQKPSSAEIRAITYNARLISRLFEREITQSNTIKTLKVLGIQDLAKTVETVGDELDMLCRILEKEDT